MPKPESVPRDISNPDLISDEGPKRFREIMASQPNEKTPGQIKHALGLQIEPVDNADPRIPSIADFSREITNPISPNRDYTNGARTKRDPQEDEDSIDTT